MTEISFSTSLKVLQESPYGKWLGLAALGVVAFALLSVVAGQMGVLWLTLLLGVLAYVAFAFALASARRIVRTHRRERARRYG